MVAREEAISQIIPFYITESTIWKSPFFFSPTLLLLYIAIICLYSSYKTPYHPEDALNTQTRTSKLLFRLVFFFSCLISLTLLTDIMVIVALIMKERVFAPVLGYYSGVHFLIWVSNTYYLMKTANKFSLWQAFQSSFYGLVIAGETMVGWLWLMTVSQSRQGSILSIYDKCLLSTFLIRYAFEVSICIFSFIRKFTSKKRRNTSQSENTHLISSSTRTESYGSTIITTTTVYSSNNSISTKLLKTMPFIWPDDNFELQARLIICIFLMLAGVSINVLTPIQVGYVVDHLEGGSGKFAWAAVLAYAGLRYFQGGAGVLKTIQNQTWEPVEEHLLTEISTELKEYLDGLSPEERAYMKVDEAQKAIFQGAKCIIQLLSQVSFHIFPLLATMVVSITVLGAGYTFLGGLIVFVTMVAYTYLTISITEKNNSKNENKKGSAVLSLTQNSIISTGVLVGSLWYAWQISKGKLTSGDFVVFNLYILQLGTPLRFLGNYYRMTQKSFKDLGKISMLFTNKETSRNVQEVNGPPGVSAMDGHIVFDRVQFGYDGERDIFKNLSFTIKRDAFVAVVGPSGCGKSTLMRLVFRFYDPLSGHIYINGEDSKNIGHSVLRQNIGFIPQNTILFNDTVLYNIRHGNIDASDDDVFHAAKVAQVHNQILKFPKGYATRLGERGYKISDSVKQRIAIARAVLKKPNLLLLDESTSALGAAREKSIQKALADFSDNCTVFFATRRLSSIVNADVVLVMKDGQLVEFGTHKELLERASRNNTPSLYYDMWQKHLDNLNSICQDKKNNSTPKIAVYDNSELEQSTYNGNINEENISSDKKTVPNFEKTGNTISVTSSSSRIPGGYTTLFPTLAMSAKTTYTNFVVSKASQFSIPPSNPRQLSILYNDHKSNANLLNHTEKVYSPIKPTRSVLVEPSSSFSSSKPAELITLTFSESNLSPFNKFIAFESSAQISSNTAKCTTTDQTTRNNANNDDSLCPSETTPDESDPVNLFSDNTSKHILNKHNDNITKKNYRDMHLTIPIPVNPESSLITSNIGEFILPNFFESNLRQFSKVTTNKSRTVITPDEIIYTDASTSQISESFITRNRQNKCTKAENAKSELAKPEFSMFSSKRAEIFVPKFPKLSAGRRDTVVVNELTGSSVSIIQETTTSKPSTEFSIKICTQQKENTGKEGIDTRLKTVTYNPIQLITEVTNRSTSSLISSYPAELIIPEFSGSKLKQLSKPIGGKLCMSLSPDNPEFSEENIQKNNPELVDFPKRSKRNWVEVDPANLDDPYSTIRLIIPSIAEPESSFMSSSAAELIIPEFFNSKLKQYNKPTINKPCASSTSKNADFSTKDKATKNPRMTQGSELSSHSANDFESITPLKQYYHFQVTAPSVGSKLSLVNSDIAELTIPKFSRSNIMKFNKSIAKKACVSTTLENPDSQISNAHITTPALENNPQESKYSGLGIDSDCLQLPCNYMKISIASLAESKSSCIDSETAELSVLEFSGSKLKQFNKPIRDRSNMSSASEDQCFFTVNSCRETFWMKFPAERSRHDRTKLKPNISQKSHNYIQPTIPSLVESKSSFINSSTTELVYPKCLDLKLNQFKKKIINKLDTNSSSREISTTKTSTPKLLETLKENNQQFSSSADSIPPTFLKSYLPLFGKSTTNKYCTVSSSMLPKKAESETSENDSIIVDIHKMSTGSGSCISSAFYQESIIHFQLSMPELKEPTTLFISSSDAELVIPLFPRTLMTKFTDHRIIRPNIENISHINERECSTSTSSDHCYPKNTFTASSSCSKGKSIYFADRIPTGSIIIKDPSKAEQISNNQEDKIARYNQSKSAMNNNTSISKYTQYCNIKADIEGSVDAKTITVANCPETFNSIIKASNESISHSKNRLMFSSKSNPTILESTVATYYNSFKADIDIYTYLAKQYLDKSNRKEKTVFDVSNNEGENISENASHRPSSSDETFNKSQPWNKTIKNGRSNIAGSIDQSPIRNPATSMQKATSVELNKATKLHTTEYETPSDNNLVQAHINTGDSVSNMHKKFGELNKSPNRLGKFSDKKSNIDIATKTTSSFNNERKKSRITRSKKDEPQRNITNSNPGVSIISKPTTNESTAVAKREDVLTSKYGISCSTSNLNSVVPTNLKKQIPEEVNLNKCLEPDISKLTLASDATVVQLEISKPAELSIAEFIKTEISEYIKSERTVLAGKYTSKESNLRQRHAIKSEKSEVSRAKSSKLNKKHSTDHCIIEITKQDKLSEANNNQPCDYSSKAENNGDTSQLHIGNRNWKKRLRRGFPTSVPTNEYFVSANAQLYIPRVGSSALDTNLFSHIANVLHLYEQDPVNLDKGYDKQIDKTIEDNEVAEALTDNYYEQSKSQTAVLNISTHSIENIQNSSNLANAKQLYSNNQTTDDSKDGHDTDPSRINDTQNIRKFNKARHIQLYTPLVAKLVSLDISTILSNYIFEKFSSVSRRFSTPSAPSKLNTSTSNSTRGINTLGGQNQIEVSVASSSKNTDNNTPIKRCQCKKNRKMKYETIEVPIKSDTIEIVISDIERFQVEYIEIEIESENELYTESGWIE